ncbi:MAG TPA: tetratricopeptide repeat protein [Bacteroidia bacterium]|nr:tetratricopeptide repeat protein [Bacteroidia bacterium]
MKKIIVFALAMTASQYGFSQAKNVVSAWKYLDDYQREQDPASLLKARARIDTAINDPDTKVEAKTWFYRGEIYLTIFDKEFADQKEKNKAITDVNKRILTAYGGTNANDIVQAYLSLKKARGLDTKKIYVDEIDPKLKETIVHLGNRGIAFNTVKDYPNALLMFEDAIDNASIFNVVDTNDIRSAALEAQKGKNYDKAKTYYQKLIDLKYGKGHPYTYLSNMYLQMNDTTNAIATIEKGRAAYPDDIDLLIAEVNIYMHEPGKKQEAINNLEIAVQKQPNNVDWQLALASMYDNMANPPAGQDPPKNYDELFGKAADHYQKAIALKPTDFDALYNMGALYNNHGLMLMKKAEDLPLSDKVNYDKDVAAAKGEYAKAAPFLEDALKVDSTDQKTMLALRQIYSITNQADKLAKINAEMKK